MRGRGRCLLFGAAASIDCRGASPVVTTDPPQAEGNMMRERRETTFPSLPGVRSSGLRLPRAPAKSFRIGREV